ncbi:MAG: Ig domain-containing protein [Planctomycetota bacterium]
MFNYKKVNAWFSRLLIAGVVGLGSVQFTGADIIGISGDIAQVDPPASVAPGAWKRVNINVFKESMRAVPAGTVMDILSSNLGQDDLSPGGNFITNSIDDIDRNHGALPTGMEVVSYYVHYDSLNDMNSNLRVGTITFERPILGVVLVNDRGGYFNLAASDSIFQGATALPPRVPDAHDFDLKTRNGNCENGGECLSFDRIIMSPDHRTITFEVRNIGKIDSMRVFIAAPTLTCSIDRNSVREDAGSNAAFMTVRRNTACLDQALTLNITSSDTTEIQVPAQVTIPVNQNSVTFALNAVDDSIDDGTQTVNVNATAHCFVGCSDSIGVESVNHPPVIVPVPNLTAITCSPFSYDVNASDPDMPADALRFRLLTYPSGATIHPVSGVITWTPEYNQIGPHQFEVEVFDDGNPVLTDSDTFTVTVSARPDVTTFATAFQVTKGVLDSGGLSDLTTSDNQHVRIFRNRLAVISACEAEVSGTSHTTTPCTLSVTTEARVFARTPVDQILELFDYQSGAFVEVDRRRANMTSDTAVTTDVFGTLDRFVHPQTRQVRARFRFKSVADRQDFTAIIDQIIWTISD